MAERELRRDAIKQLGSGRRGGSPSPAPRRALGGVIRGQDRDIVVGGQPVEIVVSSLSAITVRITILPIASGEDRADPEDGALVQEESGRALVRGQSPAPLASVRAGNLVVRFTDAPPTLHVDTASGQPVQRLTFDPTTPALSFLLPKGPAARPRRRRTAVRSQGITSIAGAAARAATTCARTAGACRSSG